MAFWGKALTKSTKLLDRTLKGSKKLVKGTYRGGKKLVKGTFRAGKKLGGQVIKGGIALGAGLLSGSLFSGMGGLMSGGNGFNDLLGGNQGSNKLDKSNKSDLPDYNGSDQDYNEINNQSSNSGLDSELSSSTNGSSANKKASKIVEKSDSRLFKNANESLADIDKTVQNAREIISKFGTNETPESPSNISIQHPDRTLLKRRKYPTELEKSHSIIAKASIDIRDSIDNLGEIIFDQSKLLYSGFNKSTDNQARILREIQKGRKTTEDSTKTLAALELGSQEIEAAKAKQEAKDASIKADESRKLAAIENEEANKAHGINEELKGKGKSDDKSGFRLFSKLRDKAKEEFSGVSKAEKDGGLAALALVGVAAAIKAVRDNIEEISDSVMGFGESILESVSDFGTSISNGFIDSLAWLIGGKDSEGNEIKSLPSRLWNRWINGEETLAEDLAVGGAQGIAQGAIASNKMINNATETAVEQGAKKAGTEVVENVAEQGVKKGATEVTETAVEQGAKTLGKEGEKAGVKFVDKGAEKAGEQASKELLKTAEKTGGKLAGKEGAKAASKWISKIAPGISVAAGTAFAAQRWAEGDYVGAVLEELSGIAGCIPPIGTAASILLDSILALRDFGVFEILADGMSQSWKKWSSYYDFAIGEHDKLDARNLISAEGDKKSLAYYDELAKKLIKPEWASLWLDVTRNDLNSDKPGRKSVAKARQWANKNDRKYHTMDLTELALNTLGIYGDERVKEKYGSSKGVRFGRAERHISANFADTIRGGSSKKGPRTEYGSGDSSYLPPEVWMNDDQYENYLKQISTVGSAVGGDFYKNGMDLKGQGGGKGIIEGLGGGFNDLMNFLNSGSGIDWMKLLTMGSADKSALAELSEGYESDFSVNKDYNDLADIEAPYNPFAAAMSIQNDAFYKYTDGKKKDPTKSEGYCAAHVANALQAGGLDFTRQASAYQYANELTKRGWSKLPSLKDPQIGDIAITGRTGSHKHGHIALYDGSRWVSDFAQRGIHVYSKDEGPITMYRHPQATSFISKYPESRSVLSSSYAQSTWHAPFVAPSSNYGNLYVGSSYQNYGVKSEPISSQSNPSNGTGGSNETAQSQPAVINNTPVVKQGDTIINNNQQYITNIHSDSAALSEVM